VAQHREPTIRGEFLFYPSPRYSFRSQKSRASSPGLIHGPQPSGEGVKNLGVFGALALAA